MIRPENWTYHKNPQRCELPTFGAFFLGRQVANSDSTIPPWAERDLLDSAGKKEKGQQEIIIRAMYHGAYEHTAYKAGGNEKGQLRVADIGVVTTSEKYTIANSNHVGLKFVAPAGCVCVCVCVCVNHLKRCKTSMFRSRFHMLHSISFMVYFISLPPISFQMQGAVAHSWVHCQRSYSWVGRISGLIIPTYL